MQGIEPGTLGTPSGGSATEPQPLLVENHTLNRFTHQMFAKVDLAKPGLVLKTSVPLLPTIYSTENGALYYLTRPLQLSNYPNGARKAGGINGKGRGKE